MKIRSSNITPCLAALLCLTLAPATKATDDEDAPKAPASQQNTADPKSDEQGIEPGGIPAHGSHESSAETKSSEGAPTRVNKASGILGMDVRNQSDEHLGHIKDLVIDWKSEGVSYAVISTAPKSLLGMGGKLVAVPLNALTANSDQKYLILNADKSKLDAATGFDSANWPSVSNPSWGAEPFWQKETTTPSTSGQPAKDSRSKANTPPESKSYDDSKPDSATKDNSKSDQNPEPPPNQDSEGK